MSYEIMMNGEVYASCPSQTSAFLIGNACYAQYRGLYVHIVIRHNGKILWRNGRHSYM